MAAFHEFQILLKQNLEYLESLVLAGTHPRHVPLCPLLVLLSPVFPLPIPSVFSCVLPSTPQFIISQMSLVNMSPHSAGNQLFTSRQG